MNLLLTTLFGGIAGFLKFYIVLLTIRVYITWFPNINVWVQPFYSIGKMTDPYLRVFRGIIPTLIGFDLSPLLGFIFLTFLIDLFSSLATALG